MHLFFFLCDRGHRRLNMGVCWAGSVFFRGRLFVFVLCQAGGLMVVIFLFHFCYFVPFLFVVRFFFFLLLRIILVAVSGAIVRSLVGMCETWVNLLECVSFRILPIWFSTYQMWRLRGHIFFSFRRCNGRHDEFSSKSIA